VVLPLIPQQGMSYIYNCYCTKLMVVFITTSSFFFLMARRGHLLFAPSKMRSTWQGLLETGSTRRGGRESPRLIEIIGSRFGVTRCSHLLATSITHFGVTRACLRLSATSIVHFGVARRCLHLPAMSITHFGMTRGCLYLPATSITHFSTCFGALYQWPPFFLYI